MLRYVLQSLEAWLAAEQAADPGLPDLAELGPAAQLMLADARTYLPANILVKLDRAAMAASLETRAPFLDRRVATVVWRLPLAMKILSGKCSCTSKWALRQLLQRQGYLHSEPIWRLWRAHQRGADHTPQLWSVLMW